MILITSSLVPPAPHNGQLTIDGLQVDIDGSSAVRAVSLAVDGGSVHCLVGESGSGKTLTSLAAVGLLPRGASASGEIRLTGVDENLLGLDQSSWPSIRGRAIGYVGQNALGCLHPAYRVGSQLVEAIRRHQPLARTEAQALAVEELGAVDLPDPERIAGSFPAQLSGGMCQRVALAIALCNRPSVLIADEPTTALDDDTQDRILELIRTKVADHGLGVLLITHDQRVVDEMADQITAIADGVSSSGPSPTTSTAAPSPAPERSTERNDDTAALELHAVAKSYGRTGRFRKPATPVLRDVSFSAAPGCTIGLVGRSGAGKTTLAQIVAGVLTPSEGSVQIDGRPITGPNRVDRVERAGLVQYVFQDPFGSLNPRRSAVAQVAEPLMAAGEPAEQAFESARRLLDDVGLTTAQAERRPTTLSGGQCQRVGIARALIRRPRVVVLDEPVSALDWSIRDEIMALLNDLQSTTGALYLLISHERSLIERESDQIYEVRNGTIHRV